MTDKNQEEIIGNKVPMDQGRKGNPGGQHPILLFFVFLLLINKFRSQGPSKHDAASDPEDEFIVDMEKNPAFPLEKPVSQEETKKSSILNIHSSQDFFTMMERMKPYMDGKNQYLLTIFDRWRGLLADMSNLSNFDVQTHIQPASSKNSGDVLNLLQDLRPFIHQDYHGEVQQISKGIENMIEVQRNIQHLQNTFTNIHQIQDNGQKINNLIDAIEPFMSGEKSSTLSQFKNLSKMMDVMKMADLVSKNPDASPEVGQGDGQNKKTDLMDLLDMLGSSPSSDPAATPEPVASAGPAIPPKPSPTIQPVVESSVEDQVHPPKWPPQSP